MHNLNISIFAPGLGTSTQIPRKILFDPGFTCTLANLKYASKGIFSHQVGLLAPGKASGMAR